MYSEIEGYNNMKQVMDHSPPKQQLLNKEKEAFIRWKKKRRVLFIY